MSKHKNLKINNKDLGTLLICAIRYTLPRETYMPSLVQDIARPHLASLENKDLKIIARDITEAEQEVTKGRTHSMGDPRIDSPAWLAFREEIKQILKSRRAQE
jgi:hypothetical protein